MNKTRSESTFRIDFRMLSILLLLGTIPLIGGTWWLFRSYEEAYLDTVGDHLASAADMGFNSINSYLQNQIMSVAALTEVPTVREAVLKANQDLQRNLDAVRTGIRNTEAKWGGLERDSPEVKVYLDNPASEFLRRYAGVQRAYREIIVTDFLGRLVAATGKTSDYYQADEDWWKETYGDGRMGSVYTGDIQYDQSAQVYSMELAQPFVQPGSGVIGVIKVVLDAQSIHTLIGSTHAGPGATAALIRAKGDVISVPGQSTFEESIYPATLDILNAREKGRSHFVTRSEPPAIYGLALKRFQDTYPHLNWIVVTTGLVEDVVGPLPQLRRYFVVLAVVIFALTIGAALLLSRTETKPVVEQDPHLERL